MFLIYWRRQVERNPLLDDPTRKMTITVAEFEKRLKLAYEQGRSDEKEYRDEDPLGIFDFLRGKK